jgi:glycosyltransferase involved in cell wall biosynthesis
VNIALIIPTLDEEANLPRLLESALQQGVHKNDIIVVDGRSVDATPEIAKRFGIRLIVEDANRSLQRNIGARASRRDHVLFVDADMELEPGLLREVDDLLASGAPCVVVPETSVGKNYWAAVRGFERSFFAGDATIEAARGFRRSDFLAAGGYDSELVGCEDWAFAERFYRLAPPARTTRRLIHHEGRVSLGSAARKYYRYGKGFGELSRRSPALALRHANPFRPSVRKNLASLLRRPDLLSGLILFKSVTYGAGAFGLITDYAAKIAGRRRGSN